MLLFIFLDGIGLGPAGPQNPFTQAELPTLRRLAGGAWVAETPSTLSEGHLYRPIDAALGVEGLPQSATGQTTMFTGINGSQLEGMHISAFPTKALRDTIAEYSLLKQASEAGYRVTFANAYSPHYWQRPERRRNRHSATTWTNIAAGLPFRDFSDLARGEAVYWDITHEVARESYAPELPYVRPEEAGRRLARIAADHDLVLWETFLTDLVGHRRIDWPPIAALERIDALLRGVLVELPTTATLMITSDHGNIEDPGTKGHTYNPVPLIVRGPGTPYFAGVHDLTGITPAVLAYLEHHLDPPSAPPAGS